MKTLILKKTASHYGGNWSDDDYVVLIGDKGLGSLAMSALPPKADMCSATRDVRFVPIANIQEFVSHQKKNPGMSGALKSLTVQSSGSAQRPLNR
jgi:hypothetical protein